MVRPQTKQIYVFLVKTFFQIISSTNNIHIYTCIHKLCVCVCSTIVFKLRRWTVWGAEAIKTKQQQNRHIFGKYTLQLVRMPELSPIVLFVRGFCCGKRPVDYINSSQVVVNLCKRRERRQTKVILIKFPIIKLKYSIFINWKPVIQIKSTKGRLVYNYFRLAIYLLQTACIHIYKITEELNKNSNAYACMWVTLCVCVRAKNIVH